MSFIDFLLKYYIYIIFVLVIIVVAVIGFLGESKSKKKVNATGDEDVSQQAVVSDNSNSNLNNNVGVDNLVNNMSSVGVDNGINGTMNSSMNVGMENNQVNGGVSPSMVANDSSNSILDMQPQMTGSVSPVVGTNVMPSVEPQMASPVLENNLTANSESSNSVSSNNGDNVTTVEGSQPFDISSMFSTSSGNK